MTAALRAAHPGLAALVMGLLLIPADGGFAVATWCLAGIVLVVVVVAMLAGDGWSPVPGAVRAGLMAGGGLVAWAAASALWAGDPASAIEGAARTFVEGLALLLAVARPWSETGTRRALAAIAAGLALAAVILLAVSAGGDPASLFIEGRVSRPTGYANATAGLWLLGVVPALYIAASPAVGTLLRIAGVGSGVLLLEVAVLSQSRASVPAIALGALVAIGAGHERGRLLLNAGLMAGAVALAAPALLDVREAARADELGASLAHARGAIAWTVLLALALAGAAHASAAPLGSRPRVRRAAGTAQRAGVPGIAVLAIVGALVAIGNPVAWARDRWDDFRTTGYEQVESQATRFTGSLGSNRYDFYRVALDELASHPLTGIGQDNFQEAYLRARRTDEAPKHPHSLPVAVAAQLGLAGIALFAGMVIALGVAVVRAARAAADRDVVIGAAAASVVWMTQAAVDWISAFTAPALLALGLLGTATRTGPAGAAVRGLLTTARARRAAAAGALVTAAAVLGWLAWAAALARDATRRAATDPRGAVRQLHRAADVMPLDGDVLVTAAVLERRLGELSGARGDLRRAVRREPDDWLARFELGLTAGASGDTATATVALARAHRMNPRQVAVERAQRDLRAGRSIEPAVYEAILQDQLARKLAPTGAP